MGEGRSKRAAKEHCVGCNAIPRREGKSKNQATLHLASALQIMLVPEHVRVEQPVATPENADMSWSVH